VVPTWTSDRSIRVDVPDASPRATGEIAARILESRVRGIADCIASARSVIVVVDPIAIEPSSLGTLADRLASIAIDGASPSPSPRGSPAQRAHTIPVCYDPRCAPDLQDAAATLGLTPAALVERHAAATYTVECIGFSPGFAYLGGLDPSLRIARKARPVPRVPAGSVGIAGDTTGIYPHPTPGGWHLIGRTPMALFDYAAEPPSRLGVGDSVRFEPIEFDAFVSMEGKG
jgi:KipI family sensor histidine kinase inhibitor